MITKKRELAKDVLKSADLMFIPVEEAFNHLQRANSEVNIDLYKSTEIKL